MLFISFYVINISEARKKGLIFLSGFLAGLAVFVNITSLFFLPFFAFVILLNKRWQSLIAWILGVIFGILPLLIYNQISFGNCLTSSYNARYGTFFLFSMRNSLNMAKSFLISPRIGLFFYFPFLILLILMGRKLWSNLTNRIILLSALFYLVCLCIIVPPMYELDQIINRWYFGQGGGGPRYLLPIIPFLLYAIAIIRFESLWEKALALILMFISVIINAPGLFWSGGQPVFFNNLLLFCKNGFHSYMVDFVKEILINKGLNVNSLSVFPLLTILGLFLWWIWIGGRWIKQRL